MNPMIPNLHGSKMSSSHPPKTKIMFLDDVEAVKQKVLEAPWHGLDTDKNGILSLVKNVLIPAAHLQLEQKKLNETSEVNGAGYTNGETAMRSSAAESAVFLVDLDGKRHTFSSYSHVEESLAGGTIQPDEVRVAVAEGINGLLDHVRKMYKSDLEWQTIDKLAYPDTTQNGNTQ